MPGVNDFQPFATSGGANVVTQAQYTALTTILANGFNSGTAISPQLNKVWRQSSFVSAAIAQMMTDQLVANVQDNGVIATFEQQLAQTIDLLFYGVDSGTANTYTVTYKVPLASVSDGVRLRFRALNANTGASTLNPSGLGAAAIFNAQHLALTGGEIVANGAIEVQWNSQLNSGGAWVLVSNSGGSQQINESFIGGSAPTTGNTRNFLATDLGKIIRRSNSNVAMTDTLPGTGSIFNSGWNTTIINGDSSASITVGAASGATIDGASSISISSGQSAVIISDGVNYWSARGFGSTPNPTGALAQAGDLKAVSGPTAPAGWLQCPTTLTYVNATTYSTLAFAIGSTWGGATSTNAGSFGIGNTYVIGTVGSTDFTLIGAANNNVGTTFKATGAGSGTGAAYAQIGLPWFAAGYAPVHGTTGIGTSSVGAVINHLHSGVVINSAFGTTNGGGYNVQAWNSTGSTGSTGGSANLAAGVTVMMCVKY